MLESPWHCELLYVSPDSPSHFPALPLPILSESSCVAETGGEACIVLNWLHCPQAGVYKDWWGVGGWVGGVMQMRGCNTINSGKYHFAFGRSHFRKTSNIVMVNKPALQSVSKLFKNFLKICQKSDIFLIVRQGKVCLRSCILIFVKYSQCYKLM